MLIMNLSGVYKEQIFYKEEAEFLDLSGVTGTNCCCDDEAGTEIRKVISEYPAHGLHFIDSGNYHYLTKMWIEKIDRPFVLIVFDNHTDMQPPAFGGILSCGGWIAAALNEIPLLKRVMLIGPDEEAFEAVEDRLKESVDFLSREKLAAMSMAERKSYIRNIYERYPLPEMPVYISVDKDVLCPGDAVTGWSQGDMKLGELTEIMDDLLHFVPAAGMDVCGECDPGQDGSANEKANAAILKLWKRTEAEK